MTLITRSQVAECIATTETEGAPENTNVDPVDETVAEIIETIEYELNASNDAHSSAPVVGGQAAQDS